MKIIVSWNPLTPLGHTIGYRLTFTNNSHSTDAELCTALDDMTTLSDVTTITLTGLTSGCYYTVFIAGVSEHFPSDTENATIYIGKDH